MELKRQEKNRKIDYPQKSFIYNNHKNSIINKVPIFSILLSSLISNTSILAVEFEENYILEGGVPVNVPPLAGVIEVPYPIRILPYITSGLIIISIISLITTISYAIKLHKFKNTDLSNANAENSLNSTNDTKGKKLKKKLIISSIIMIISFIITALLVAINI